MYISPFLKAIACALLITSCNAEQQSYRRSFRQMSSFNDGQEKSEQYEQESQSYSRIKTSQGVLAYLEQALDADKLGMHKSIFIEHLTGKNDLATSGNEALVTLLKSTNQDTAETITLSNVALIIAGSNITVMFSTSEDAENAVKIEYNLHDETTRTFKDGLSSLKTIDRDEFSNNIRSLKQQETDVEEKFHNQWKLHQEEMNKHFEQMERFFGKMFHEDRFLSNRSHRQNAIQHTTAQPDTTTQSSQETALKEHKTNASLTRKHKQKTPQKSKPAICKYCGK
jgi:hypothetical protein